jgi:isoamylase
VILDVVYNHTAEGNQLGPTLSFKGIDNASYYRLMPDDRATTSTTPAPATRSTCPHPRVLQLVMDSLRYWVEMHVDGFRFDLAHHSGARAARASTSSGVLRHRSTRIRCSRRSS